MSGDAHSRLAEGYNILRTLGHGARIMLAGRARAPRVMQMRDGDQVGYVEVEQEGGARILLFVFHPTPIEPNSTLLADGCVSIPDDRKAGVFTTGEKVITL